MKKTVCEELMAVNSQVADHLMIESAAMVDHYSQTVWAGIQIKVGDMHMPLFISAQDLRDLADEADKTIKAQMGIKDPKTTKKKLK